MLLLAALTTLSVGANAETWQEPLVLQAVLSTLPKVDVTHYQLGSPPVPTPHLEGPLPHLRVQRIDDEVLVDVVPFDAFGEPRPEAMASLRRAFRSRGGDEVDVDARLVELLVMLSSAFEGKAIRIVSAHRAPGRGTRKTSYHVSGMAADIAILGVSPRDLRKAAIRLGARGVGLYPHFVHVDVRDAAAYRWYGGWGRRRR